MRNIQFAQQFTQHFSIVIVIVDMWQELTVSGGHGIPVYSMHIYVIETCLFLTVYIVEHIFAFGRRQHFHAGIECNRFQSFGWSIHFLHSTSAQDKDILTFLIHFHVSPAGIHLMQQLGFTLAKIHLPHIKPVFECWQVIQFLPIFRDNGRS